MPKALIIGPGNNFADELVRVLTNCSFEVTCASRTRRMSKESQKVKIDFGKDSAVKEFISFTQKNGEFDLIINNIKSVRMLYLKPIKSTSKQKRLISKL